MSEAEALEVAGIYLANAITAFSVYITFTMAYLVASFYAGSQLTKFQALVSSTLYVFGAVSAILSEMNSVSIYGDLIKLSPIGMASPFSSGEFWALFMPILMGTGVFVSLFFMWSVRNPRS